MFPIDELALKLHMSSTEVKGIERPWWDDKIRVARHREAREASECGQAAARDGRLWRGRSENGRHRRDESTEGAIVPYADEGATIIDGHTGERPAVPARQADARDQERGHGAVAQGVGPETSTRGSTSSTQSCPSVRFFVRCSARPSSR